MSPSTRVKSIATIALFWACAVLGAPLPHDAVPDPLKSWVPWVLHGDETVACPPAWNSGDTRTCIWPSRLDVEVLASGARFVFGVETFGADTAVPLPGSAEVWPQDVTLDGKVAVVVMKDGDPVLMAPAGRHVVEGRFLWSELPPSLDVPDALALVRVKDGANWVARQPGEGGQLWLKAEDDGKAQREALTLRTFRRIEDGQALLVSSRFELTFAGKPREVTLPHALLAGFTPVSLNSPLPARLGADGALRLQARAGEFVIEIVGRRLDRVAALPLPKDGGNTEIWSWAAQRDLRVVDVSGSTVDPKQAGVPQDWQSLPAFMLRPGDSLGLAERRRGDPDPTPDKLNLMRTLWLDSDGGGFTLQDRIAGTVSRSWRLESRAPLALGHAVSDGVDQYITQLAGSASPGFELRHGVATIVAESRVEGGARTLPAGGWNTEFQQVSAELRLPPGWQLLHAGGVDRAEGAWLSAWTLWDVFFVLLIVLAAWRVYGAVAAGVLGAGLVLSWHVSGSPGSTWLLVLGVVAMVRALPESRFTRFLAKVKGGLALVILLQLLVFGVTQVRCALYPVLEETESSSWSLFPQSNKLGGVAEAPVAATPPPAPAAEPQSDASPKEAAPGNDAALNVEQRSVSAEKVAKSSGSLFSGATNSLRNVVDAGTQVQTGPGLPQWNWHSYRLSVQGPVTADQNVRLWLLPPGVHAVVRVLSTLLLAAAFALFFLRGRRFAWPGRGAAPVAIAALALALTGFPAGDAKAAPAAPTQAQNAIPPSPEAAGFQHWLDALREKLLEAPACLPECAQLSRLMLEADADRALLRLEAHAATDLSLPLPGQAGQLKVVSVLVDDQPASLFRDDEGNVWLHLLRGVHQIVVEASVADTSAVNISLPLAPHRVEAKLTGWTLSGVGEGGVPQGALTLTRIVSGGKAASETTRDALPPLVQVERTLRFADRWTAETTIKRISPSLAPVEVVIALLPGERVTDGAIPQNGETVTLTLGAQTETHFSSALGLAPRLVLKANAQPNQILVWRLDADTRWHVRPSGLAPVLHQQGQVWLPQWQPWPGDTLTLDVTRPKGVPGASLTLDALTLMAQPGQRASDMTAELVLRASLGGTHSVMLPAAAQLQSVTIDGAPQAVRAEGRWVNLPIHPGSQKIEISWREPSGVHLLQSSAGFDTRLPGANLSTRLALGPDRWVLLAGGPRQGPAVLFWGTMAVMVLGAFVLARSRMTPLGWGAWTLLGIGIAQSTLVGAAVVAGWFLLLAWRARVGEHQPASRWRFNALQVLVGVASLVVIGVLGDAIRSGLLGSPDMLIEGNGSSGGSLIWYQDRFNGAAPSGWAFSVPLWVYRGVMLAWALWLAASVLKWVRWGWECFGRGGYWRVPVRIQKTE